MITFALLVAAFIALVILPCMLANALLNLRTNVRQPAASVTLTAKVA